MSAQPEQRLTRDEYVQAVVDRILPLPAGLRERLALILQPDALSLPADGGDNTTSWLGPNPQL